MRNRLIYICVVVSFLSSCASFKFLSEDMNGIYLQQENGNIQLVLNGGSFLHIDTYEQMDAPPYKCCDTLTYGNWDIDKDRGFLKLSSAEELNTNYVYMDVEEKVEGVSDSIYFFIDNPIEEHYKKFREKYRELFYSISVTSESPDFDARLASEVYDANPIRLYNPRHSNIQKFYVSIIPKSDIPVRNVAVREVYTLEYEVKNPNSNIFKIKLPQLDYGFISYQRLTDDYVKIVNKNRLLWDGQEYVKSTREDL